MLRAIYTFIFRTWGWTIVGEFPPVPKMITVVLPHTSNWDFPIGILLRRIKNRNIQFVAKSSLFRPPLGWLLKWMGGYPVNRSKRNNFVDAVIDTFNKEERLDICITPEGTRDPVSELKTGFYYIAKGANVPLVLVGFDWGQKQVCISDPIYIQQKEKEEILDLMADFFSGMKGKIPENAWIRLR